MTIGKRITEARLAKGWNKSELARAVGVSPPTVSEWESGIMKEIRNTNVLKLAKALGVTQEWLQTGRGIEANTAGEGGYLYDIPVISWVSAGIPSSVFDPYAPGNFERMMQTTKKYKDGTFALTVMGDSMEAPSGASFPDGCDIIVEPATEAKHNQFVIVRLKDSDEAVFKQLVIEGNKKYLKPLNPRYPIEVIEKDAVICGVVRQMIYSFD